MLWGGVGREDFPFPEDRCGHISGSCSCLTAFPVLPAPSPLFPILFSCLGGTGNSGQGTFEDNHGVLMAVSFLLPDPTACLTSWGRCRPWLAVPVVYTWEPSRREDGQRVQASLLCLRSHGWIQEPLHRAPLPSSSITRGVVALSTPSSGSYRVTDSPACFWVPSSLHPDPSQKLDGSRSPGRQMQDQISFCQ